MKSKKTTTIPSRRRPANLTMMRRREPRHPVMGTLAMSLARALTAPPVTVDDEEIEVETMTTRRRKAA